MRRWIRLIAALIAVAALALLALAMARGVLGLTRLSGGKSSGEPDPMFAEPAERVTRPPEPEATAVVSEGEDPSLNWVYETLTPVEKTAKELAESLP